MLLPFSEQHLALWTCEDVVKALFNESPSVFRRSRNLADKLFTAKVDEVRVDQRVLETLMPQLFFHVENVFRSVIQHSHKEVS